MKLPWTELSGRDAGRITPGEDQSSVFGYTRWRCLLELHMEISSRKFNIGEMDVTYKCKSLWKVGGILGHEPK